VVEYIRAHQLDGLDVDWEYPGLPGAEPHSAPKTSRITACFSKSCAFVLIGSRRTSPAALCDRCDWRVAGVLDHTEMPKVVKYVDTVNLMAYDYYEPDSDATTGHHAPLYSNPADPKGVSADRSVEEYVKAGVPPGRSYSAFLFMAYLATGSGHQSRPVPAREEAPHGFAPLWQRPEDMLKNGFTRYWIRLLRRPIFTMRKRKSSCRTMTPSRLG